MDNSVVISTPPHVKSKRTTRGIMIDVAIALLPSAVAGCVFFGWQALLIILMSVFACVATEFVYFFIINKGFSNKCADAGKVCVRWLKQFDFTSVVTGLILALILPVTDKWYEILYEVLIGGVFLATFLYNLVDPSWLPLLGALIMVPVFSLMYRALSFRKRSLTFGLVGGLFTTTAMIILFYLSFILIHQMIAYNRIYGSLASLVALLLVIYIIGSVIYLGFLLNIVFEESYGKEETLPMKHVKYYALCERVYNRLPFVIKD